MQKTTVDVVASKQDKIGVYEGKVVCNVLTVIPHKNGSISVSAEYCNEDLIPFNSINKTYTSEEKLYLYSLIEDFVTKKEPVAFIWECVERALVLEMAASFGLSTSQIETV